METKTKLDEVTKRDGTTVSWDLQKVSAAAAAALRETGEGLPDGRSGMLVAVSVAQDLEGRLERRELSAPIGVEDVQDAVERALMALGYAATAKAYILYRKAHEEQRDRAALVSAEARTAAEESSKHFPNALGEFIYYRTYSRYRDDLGRRETWEETVDRYMAFMREKLGDRLKADDYVACREGIVSMQVMPSMRLLWSAGDAARATNVAAFNCSFIAPSKPRDFGEILYILACGTGVGFAAESQNAQELPIVRQQRGKPIGEYKVEDSKEGWARALVLGMEEWYAGNDLTFDFSGVRPEGARLVTMGGRSSGPRLLEDLLKFTRRLILSRQGKRLSNLDVHDLVCKIGECIVSGGVRRSALISLSDLDDDALRDSKKGYFYPQHPHRALANNSAVYNERPSDAIFMREWLSLVESRSGERGIFNRGSLGAQIPARRRDAWVDMGAGEFDVVGKFRLRAQVGTNPCGEINLLSKQFCNLTEVVCRHNDTPSDLIKKVRVAAILGTYQSTLTDFPFLSKEWKDNCDRERLLGVSLTGQWDCGALFGQDSANLLSTLRNVAVEENRRVANLLGIPASTAVTCGKPSGTVSQLVDAASGGHPRFAQGYIRRVRISSTDPLFRMMRDQGVPAQPEDGQTPADAVTWVLEFPVRGKRGPYAPDVKSLEQLEHWLRMKKHFTEHNPSVTIYVGDDEWVDVGHWVLQNWESIGGLSFLPRQDSVYKLAPYEEADDAALTAMEAAMPKIDYSLLAAYEREDNTTGSKELACVGNVCEI